MPNRQIKDKAFHNKELSKHIENSALIETLVIIFPNTAHIGKHDDKVEVMS